MVGCRLPLAAVLWARQKFVPVIMGLPNFELGVVGLLAKHACTDLLNTHTGQPMICLSRYFDRDNRWRDLTLAVPRLNMPVGLIPDMTYGNETGLEVAYRLSIIGCDPYAAETLQLMYF
jgi:hypothetical protein